MTHLDAFRKKLIDAGADAAILSDELNQRYLSSFAFEDGLLLVTKENAYLLTDFRYEEAAKAEANPGWKILTPGRGQMLVEITLIQFIREDRGVGACVD